MVKGDAHINSGDAVAEYDPTYDYIVSSVEGKVIYIDLDVNERTRKIEEKNLH